MPIQTYPIVAPRGGLRFDLPADLISDVEMSAAKNVYFEDGLIKKRYGYVRKGINLPLNGALVGLALYTDFSANKTVVAATEKLCHKWDSGQWEVLHANEVVDDCETTWTSDMGANGSVADETEIKKVGDKSQKITVNTAFTTGLIAHHDQSLGDKSTYSFARLWLRSDTDVAAGALQFCADNTAGCGSPTETVDLPALTADVWKIAIVEFSDPATNLTSIESLGIKVAADLSTTANVVIYIDDIRFVKGFGSTVADSDFLSTCQILDKAQTDPWLILTNGVDNIQKWIGSGTLLDLGGEPPKAKHILTFKDYIIALDITSGGGNRYPQRIQWCDTAGLENWSTGNSGNLDLRGPGDDWIKGAVTFKGDHVIICRENSIWLLWATGEDVNIFDVDKIVSGQGCAAGRTIKNLPDEIVFLGRDDVYSCNGIDIEPIGAKIQRELFETLNPEQMNRAFAKVNEEQKEYWLFVVTGTNTYPDEAWCFHYDLRTWSRHSYADYLTCAGEYELEATRTIDDLAGSFDAQNWRYDDRRILKAAPVILFGDKDGYVYEYDRTACNDDGNAIEYYFDTKAFNFTGRQNEQRVMGIDIMGRWTGVDVYYRTDGRANKNFGWKLIQSVSPIRGMLKKLFFRSSNDNIIFRFTKNAVGSRFWFSRANIHWLPGGRLL